MLIILSGLPGTGKTSIARELAHHLRAVHIRIDSIEQAIRESSVKREPMDDTGYRVGYAIAADNLSVGRTVIADSVNPLPLTRDAWLAVAERIPVSALEIEIICSDASEHRRRVETRTSDVCGLKLPTWAEVIGRDYRRWDRARLVIDTAHVSVQQSASHIREMLITAKMRHVL